MNMLEQAARDFLELRRIAVAGVSRKGDVPANGIYKKLRETGHEVFPVNPHAVVIDGDACYPTVGAIPGGVDGVVIATHPRDTAGVVRDCGKAGIKRVWIHRSFGEGSLSDEAVALCEDLGIDVIPGSCPMMFCDPVDPFHKCFRWYFRVRGKQPEPMAYA